MLFTYPIPTPALPLKGRVTLSRLFAFLHFIHSLVNSFTRSLIRSLIESLIHRFAQRLPSPSLTLLGAHHPILALQLGLIHRLIGAGQQRILAFVGLERGHTRAECDQQTLVVMQKKPPRQLALQSA